LALARRPPTILPKTRFAKRALDLTVSALGVAVLLPVLPVVAVLIKLESPGPVFRNELLVGLERRRSGSDERGGRRLHDARGRLFRLRSFRVTRELGGGRTRMGAVLAWTGLERLPRLLSVLSDDMSLVGPRASSPGFIDEVHRRCPAVENRIGGVRPGLFGFAARVHGVTRQAGETFFTRLADRIYVDQVYCERLERCSGFDVVLLDLSVLVRRLVPLAAVQRNRQVRVEHPGRYSVVPVQIEELVAAAPAQREARAEAGDRGLTVSWVGATRPTIGWPAMADESLQQWCDDVFVEAGQLRVTFDLDPRDTQGRDLVRVELPRLPGDLGEPCRHLAPVWDALAPRSGKADFADRVNAAVIEGLALVASRAGHGTGALVVQAAVEPGRLALTFEALSAGRLVEAVSSSNSRTAPAA
jgi:lipopolysaccharide/colanic/teichoic acid biosynthesis glycosyltransferase